MVKGSMRFKQSINLVNLKNATRRRLRSPKVICAEILALTVLCALGAAIPQVGIATDADLQALRESGPLWRGLVQAFALDHVFRSPGFLIAALAASASLFVIVLEQSRRLYVQWRQTLSPAHFQAAPFKVEFERPARTPGLGREAEPQVQIWSERRLGLAGSALFHSGLLLVIVAAALRALFGAEAVVDLLEGEELTPSAASWSGQWPGMLAKPIQFTRPLKLVAVQASLYESGDLRNLKVRLELPVQTGTREAEIAVNRDLRLPGGRLFLANEFGAAALVEWRKDGMVANRQAALLTSPGGGAFEGALSLPNGDRIFLRAHVDAAGHRPERVQVRVMKGKVLLYAGDLSVGETAALPQGARLALCGTPFWARLRGSRDSTLWLAYTGFALLMLGATLIFTVVKLDACIVVTPTGERESVFVAFKPHRFAPLFQERFQQLVERLGGPANSLLAFETSRRRSERDAAMEKLAPRAPESPVNLDLPVAAQRALLLLLVVGAPALTGCGPSALAEARQLVQRYNETVSEAYRRGDARVAVPVVGANEGRKLVGLIGVRLDLGITLNSELLALEITGVEKTNKTMRVRTTERWRYRDLRIGSGAPVGEESVDSYEMLYVFEKTGKTWLADEIAFTAPPKVGRKRTPWPATPAPPQALANSTPGKETRQP